MIMQAEANVTFPVFFTRKNTGSPIQAASEKQISCRFVKLKKILVFTRDRSQGTGTCAVSKKTPPR